MRLKSFVCCKIYKKRSVEPLPKLDVYTEREREREREREIERERERERERNNNNKKQKKKKKKQQTKKKKLVAVTGQTNIVFILLTEFSKKMDAINDL